MKKLLIVCSSLLMCSLFAFAQQDIALNFALKADDNEVVCGQQVALGSTQGMSEITDARLYVSDVRVITEGGEQISVSLTQDGVWQYENVALLDFENATGACQGTPEINTQIVGTTDADTITGVAFTVGVPEELNHLDAAIAASPLNVTDMWWAWLFGYKYIKIDLTSGGMMDMNATTDESTASTTAETTASGEPSEASTGHGDALQNGWFIHLGSTGCVGEDSVFPPDEPCGNPNRIEVTLENLDPASNTIVLDLNTLLAGVDVSRSLKLEPPGCMSEATDPDCEALFTSGFGLSLENGQQLVESPAFFRVE
jgi:uncharacterized repeat protein (TIGR04052 family)